MIKNSRGFIHILVLLILVLVVIAGTGFHTYKNSWIKEETPTSNISPTKNWKIYTNTEFSYEVKYVGDEPLVSGSDDTYLGRALFNYPEKVGFVWFSIEIKKSNLKLETEYIKQESDHVLVRLANEENIIHQGYPTKKLEFVPMVEKEGQKPTTFVIIQRSDYTYTIASRPEYTKQILFTFKFLDKKCGEGEYLKECKMGPCCCPNGAICD